jgi:hypothetical protein
MAINNPSSDKKSQKKMITILLLIVVVIIIIWQLFSLFGSSAISEEVALTNQISQTPNPQTPAATGAPPPVTSPPPPHATAVEKPSVVVPVTAPGANTEIRMEDKIIKLQKEVEDKYIEQVNKLQFLKIQREIEDMNQAIASARLATVTAEKNAGDLLTTPTASPPPPAIPAGAYSNTLVNPIPSGTAVVSSTTTGTAQPANPPPPILTDIPYVVISVTMQLGHWNAVIGYQGKLFNVSVGDVLPVDGSIVASINRNGVTLMKEGKPKKISISSSI